MERHRPSLIGPLILITIGILLLLANLGYLPLSFWEIAWRFWPLILILIGLEIIIGRHSRLGALLIIALWCALIAGILWLALTSGGAFLNTTLVTETIHQPLADIKSATIDLNIGLAAVKVAALDADTADLMRGTFRHAEGIKIGKRFNTVGSEGRLHLQEERTNFFVAGMTNAQWDLALNPTLPLALRINGGVGNAELDLRTLNLTALDVDAGVGTIRVTTPTSGNVTMRLNGGVGNLHVTIPEGVAARIRADKGIGALRVNETRFPKAGNVYQSADFVTTLDKVEIQIDGGVGTIEIR